MDRGERIMEKTIEIQLQELREKIAADIEAIDLADFRSIGSDAFFGAIRMRTMATFIARGK